MNALVGIELHGVKQHFVGAAFVGGEVVGAHKGHLKAHIFCHIGYLLRVGAEADVAVVGESASHLDGVGYERFAAQRFDVFARNALAATAGRDNV